ncbi:hypothetical protein HZ992_12305 [Rhizobacter sp. AJA081-3]|uniref:hypothetical protein n=1 Tax=Rhizobacter sp. AJA081-3 TaxID=2753607 RepID=UPI001AE00055|nr:hypothetical protein [Rhizobacter sp. AJA081-3]QTN25681.1 hypothetical protein HZ992_12305 [Rhizobacter sp. AJA081-3]
MSEVKMPEPTWQRTLQLHWERRPVVLPARDTLVSPRALFTIACELGARCPQDGPPSDFVVHFASGQRRAVVAQALFPRLQDQTFSGYAARIERELSTRSFLLYVRGFAEHAPALRERALSRLQSLRQAGLHWRHLEVELYIGRYDWTAIGVHRERCGNLHEVILGRKQLLFWPPRVLAARGDRPECAQHGESRQRAVDAGLLDRASVCCRARSGETIYFPSGHWHVGASPRLSAAVDLALYGIGSSRPGRPLKDSTR